MLLFLSFSNNFKYRTNRQNQLRGNLTSGVCGLDPVQDPPPLPEKAPQKTGSFAWRKACWNVPECALSLEVAALGAAAKTWDLFC